MYSQASREDFSKLDETNIDASVPIVTVIIDCTTDKLHFHFCKASVASSTKDFEDELAQGDSVAEDVLGFATLLSGRCTKDAVPYEYLAKHLATFVAKCHNAGKVVHLLLTGCNSVGLVLPVCRQLDVLCPDARGSAWILATNSVWPGDLSTFLWSQYGCTVSPNLDTFRCATRMLLDDFTEHWKRQKLQDPSIRHMADKSLSDFVLLDRLDKVEDDAGFAKMSPL